MGKVAGFADGQSLERIGISIKTTTDEEKHPEIGRSRGVQGRGGVAG
jgi:hypothetical protein